MNFKRYSERFLPSHCATVHPDSGWSRVIVQPTLTQADHIHPRVEDVGSHACSSRVSARPN
jgi:hypothetical protein